MSTEKRFILQEDWTAVLLGFIIIILAIAGVQVLAPSYSWTNVADLQQKVFAPANIGRILWLFVFVFLVAAAGVLLTGKPIRALFVVFPVLFILTTIAMLLAGNAGIKSLNLEAVIFSLCIGLIIGNAFNLPAWFRALLSTELFVKIGLVLLGTTIVFSDILRAGSLGLIQALVVVLSVWYFAWWICKKLKVDEELRMMIASAVSICGVSAAIATAGAIKGDNKKLSYVISLVLITAVPMMIGMPYLAKYWGLSEPVTGAWLGGSIDTTGAVVASGTLVGVEALRISTIVKFSQNVLLGLAAFAISVYWTYTNNPASKNQQDKPTLYVIWERFPKFVLGFIAASLLFSFFLEKSTIDNVKDSLKNIQTLWFTLAFTSIGLETNFSDFFKSSNRKPLYGFLIAQLFNIIITLGIAWLLFR